MNHVHRLSVLIFTLALAGCQHCSASDAEPAGESSRTDWLKDARIGAFMHFLHGDAAGFAQVADFDVDELADVIALRDATADGLCVPETARLLARWTADGVLPAR